MPSEPVPPVPAAAFSTPSPAGPAAGRLASAPGVRTLASPRFRLLIASTLAILGVLILGAAMLRQAADATGQFGIDFGDYHGAARALLDTGHPYAPEMLAGPVDAQGLERYRYPPLLAQLLVPLAGSPLGTAAAVWLLLQAVAMVAAVWLALGAAGVPRHAERAAWSVVACLVFMPVFDTLWKGNVSGFVALMVALVAMGGATAGVGAVAGTLLKVVPGTLLPLLLAEGRRAILAGLATAAAAISFSVLLTPTAWADYAVVLPNLLGGSADYATNLAPATIAERAGAGTPIPSAIRLATLAGAALLTLAAPIVAWRHHGFHGRAAGVTLATAAMLLLPAAAWYHYLAALLPVAALAWPAASTPGRLGLLGAAVAISIGVAALPLATLGSAVLLTLATAIHLRAGAGAASTPVVAGPRPAAAPKRS
jgi:alpha-1,2-mannosyltransferase